MPSVSAKSLGYGGKARTEKLRALAEYILVDIQKPGGKACVQVPQLRGRTCGTPDLPDSCADLNKLGAVAPGTDLLLVLDCATEQATNVTS